MKCCLRFMGLSIYPQKDVLHFMLPKNTVMHVAEGNKNKTKAQIWTSKIHTAYTILKQRERFGDALYSASCAVLMMIDVLRFIQIDLTSLITTLRTAAGNDGALHTKKQYHTTIYLILS